MIIPVSELLRGLEINSCEVFTAVPEMQYVQAANVFDINSKFLKILTQGYVY